MPEIGNIELNFQVVDTDDPKMLIVYDFSQWRVIENIPAYIEVTLPGSREPIVQPFQKKSINGFNSLTLGISCHTDCEENLVDLPDGIYKLCLRGGKDGKWQKIKFFLKKDRFQLNMDEAIVRLPKNYVDAQPEAVNDLVKVNSLLQSAESHTRLGEISDANDYFTLANNLLDKYRECKDCI